MGKRADYTAVCVARVIERPSPLDGKVETAYIADVLERIELGINYMDQAQAVYAMVVGLRERSIQERGNTGVTFEEGKAPPLPFIRLFADETGVGDSFCDAVERLLGKDVATRAVEMLRIRFVGGEQYKRHWERGAMRGTVGKELIARKLTTMVKSRRVTLPANLAGRFDTEEELRAYEARMREEDGHTTYGAQAPGTHDDILTSLALAVLEGWNDYGVTYGTVRY